MINHILVTSRIPWILEQKEININEELLSVDIDKNLVRAHLAEVEDVMKFEGWVFKAFEKPTSYGTAGQITVQFEGIEFFSGVKIDELSLVES